MENDFVKKLRPNLRIFPNGMLMSYLRLNWRIIHRLEVVW